MKKGLMVMIVWLACLPLLPRQQMNAQTANDTVRFAFFSDVHYGMTEYNGEKLYQNDWMRKALSGSLRRKAEFIFVGGDIVDASNNAAQYDMFDNEMVTPLPWYPMCGNHDVGADPAGATMAKLTAWNARGYGRGSAKREYYGFVQKNIGAFFVLNTQAFISADAAVRARATAQLAEMDSFFVANASVPNKVVLAHVPLFTVSQTEDSAYFSVGPFYRQRILAVMNKNNVKTYVAGHRHVNADVTAGGITVYSNTALSFQLGTGNVRGYYVYTMTRSGIQRAFYPLTAEPAANKWKWIAYGDTRTNDDAHRSVLQSIMKHTPDYRFMFNVGDVVEDGQDQALWDIFHRACSDILGGEGQKNYPPKYMSVAGNHDDLGSAAGLATWKLNLTGQQQFGHEGRYFYFDHENARFLVLDAFDSLGGTQGKLLNEAIRTNTKQWLFAIWHVPIFSYGDKAYEDSLNQMWGKQLSLAGCDIIFCGHQHYYVRGKKVRLNGDRHPPLDPINGTAHIVTGNGGAPLRPSVENFDGNEYMVAYRSDKNQPAYFGYTELDMDGDAMVLRHYSAAGVVMDSMVYKANAKGQFYRISTHTTGTGSIQITPADSIYRAGTYVRIKAVPALGSEFVQWSGARTGAANPDSILIDGDIDITAGFRPISGNVYEVRSNVIGDGAVLRSPAGPYYAPGTKVTLTATPNAGQKFVGWSGDTTSTSPVITLTVNVHMMVTAEFRSVQSYNVNLRSSSMGSVTLTPGAGPYIEGSKVAVKAVPAAGWAFYSWTGDLNGTKNPDTLLVDGPKEVRALYKKTGMSMYELQALEDTYVRGGIAYQSKNFNTDPYLLVREGSSLLNQARAYIKFDVSAVKGKVLAAWLKLHVKADGLPDGAPAKASAYPSSDDSWSETLLKWSGAPVPGTILDSTITVSSTDKDYAIDATSHVAAKLAGNKLVSLIVKDPTISDKALQFEKREGGTTPTLVIVTDQVTGVVEGADALPADYRLYQNYPNPFNPSTQITFSLPRKEHVEIKVYDMIGREIAVLQQGMLEAGTYSRVWNADRRSSGIYICRMKTAVKNEIIRMTLLK